MKALFILPNLAAGGVERQWSILVPGLRERGIDARLLALDAGGPFEAPVRDRGVPVEVLGVRHQLDAPRLLSSWLLRGFAPDVVVSQGVSALCVGELVARLRRAPHLHADHRQVALALTPRREAIVRLIAPHLDRVIAVSGAQTAAWEARRVRADRITVIANGAQTPRVLASKAELRARLGLPGDAIVALLVATLRPEKRAADFVRAVALARKSNPSLIGLVVGDGPDRVAVRAAASADPGIKLLGHRDDVEQLMQAADVFVLTSAHEAMPMALLEAMAAGLPVLATRAGDVASVVGEGESGWLVAPADPGAMAVRLAQLTSDEELRTAMGAAARRRHRESGGAEAMVEAYAQLLGHSLLIPRQHWRYRIKP